MTLLLSTKENETNYITALTREELDLLIKLHKENKNNEIDKKFNIQSKNIKLIGETDRYEKDLKVGTKIKPYIESFTTNHYDETQLHYRNYNTTLERQKSLSWLIVMCSDYNASWKTIMYKLKNPCCCVIWSKPV